jgi:predicted glycoside hydrolase/deacetylase ChbG (UPF0249 family)
MRLIVNGDDFGFSPGQNLGILRAHEEGILTSTTAMANGPYLEEALASAGSFPDLGIGVHLVVDWGKPVLPAESVPSLVDDKGNFRRHEEHLPISLNPQELQREWSAQIERIMSLGVKPTHLDGHHHLHLHPDLLETTLFLAMKYDLPIRYLSFHHGPKEEELMDRYPVKKFLGLTDFYWDKVSAEYFRDFRKNHEHLREPVLEVMCHPAYLDDIIYTRSSYTIHRVKELVILTDPKVKEDLKDQKIHLGNVRDFLP